MKSKLYLATFISLTSCNNKSNLLSPDDARAAVLSYVIANHDFSKSAKSVIPCVGFGKPGSLADPDVSALEAVRRIHTQIQPASACALNEKSGQVEVNDTDQPAIIFFAEAAVCSTGQCTVASGYVGGPLNAEGKSYIASPKGTAWQIKVDPNGPAWIS